MPTYTVFVSSTFADFAAERPRLADLLSYADVHVITAERAGDRGKSLLETLKSLIDRSDIVVLLIGSRAGSTSVSGQTWTKEEVDHALARGKRMFAYKRELAPELLSLTDRDPKSEPALSLRLRAVEEKIAIVPRYNHNECCKLTAMVVRDVLRCVEDLTEAAQQARIDRGFKG